MKKIVALLFLLFVILVLHSCQQKDESCEAPLNPNGTSELAELMRHMMDYVKQEREAILNHTNKIVVSEGFEKILTAQATEGMEITENFPSYGKHFLQQLETYKNCAEEQRTETFNSLIASCVNCHTSHCPGPIGAIEKNILDTEI